MLTTITINFYSGYLLHSKVLYRRVLPLSYIIIIKEIIILKCENSNENC